MSRRQAIKRALDLYPGSLRKLARESGYSHGYLVRVRAGDKPASDALMRAILNALGTAQSNIERARILLKTAS